MLRWKRPERVAGIPITFPVYSEINDCLASLSMEDVTNEEFAERLGIAPDWMDAIDTSQLA